MTIRPRHYRQTWRRPSEPLPGAAFLSTIGIAPDDWLTESLIALRLPRREAVNMARGYFAAGPGGPAHVPTGTVTTGNITLRNMDRDAAPYFAGFINDLRARGAPISDIGSYNYRNIAGTNKLSEHAFGWAIDIEQRSRNVVSPRFAAWARTHWADIKAAESRWGMQGGEDWRHPDFGHWEWKGRHAAAVNPAARVRDRSH